MSELDNDPELLAAFFDESGDTLQKVATLFVDLEKAPNDIQIVEAIFRPVHSLKGNSAFFGFLGIKRLAHEMETVLDHVRKGRLVASPEIVTTLLAGLDGLMAMVERLRNGGPEVNEVDALEALIERQRKAGAGADQGAADPLRIALSTVEAWMIRQGAALDQVVSASIQAVLLNVRQRLGLGEKSSADVIPAPLEPRLVELRTLVQASFTSDPDAAAVERMGSLVGKLGELAGDDRGKKICAELAEAWTTCIGAAGFNDIVRDFLAQQIEALAAMPGFTEGKNAATAQPTEALEAKASKDHSNVEARQEPRSDTFRRSDKAEKAEGKSVRVSEGRIDTFLQHVGELLVIGDMFNHLQARVRALAGGGTLPRDFRRVNDTFAQLSSKLQQSIMSIRKVPIRSHLNKVPRIVRDVAVAKGKEIAVEIRGEDVEIDKSLVELIDAPLTHMSRNAADHGVETPERRLAVGKPREGRVIISVEETARAVVLCVSDDGAGLNLERIRAKGESLGLVQPGAEMTQQDLINLIFASGLSTAEVVSDVSGRGVGMDVVKRMIEEAGGSIQITTKTGEGTEFRLNLPKGVTTQIVPAFLVRAGGNLVALPLERVRETFLRRGTSISRVPGVAEGAPGELLLLRHDEALPLVSLAGLLGIAPAPANATAAEELSEPTIVTIDCGGRRLAVAVREVIGVRKIVVRPLDGLPAADGLYLGGAMMGDGAVVLIVNPDALLGKEAARA